MDSYAGLTANAKHETLERLAGFAHSVEADFQLLRVASPWSPTEYAKAAADARERRTSSIATQLADVPRRSRARPRRRRARPRRRVHGGQARGRSPTRPTASGPGSAGAVGLRDARGISRRRLDDVLRLEARAFARVEDYLRCDRATTAELQWLVARSFSRAVAEPYFDDAFAPQALVVDAPPELRRWPLRAARGRPHAPIQRGDHGRLAPADDRDRRRDEPPGAPCARRAAGGRRVPRPAGRAPVRAAGGARLLRRRVLQRTLDRQRRGARARPPATDRRRPRLRRGEPRRPRPDDAAAPSGPPPPASSRTTSTARRARPCCGRRSRSPSRRRPRRVAGARRPSAPRVRADDAPPAVRRAARPVPVPAAGPAPAGPRLRRRPDVRAARRDGADGDARRRLVDRACTSATPCRAPGSRCCSTSPRRPGPRGRRPCCARGRSARGRRSRRSCSPTRASSAGRGSSRSTQRATTAWPNSSGTSTSRRSSCAPTARDRGLLDPLRIGPGVHAGRPRLWLPR